MITLDDFITAFSEEFDETPADEIHPGTIFKELGQYDSLMSLSILAMIDEIVGKRVSGEELRSCKTVEDLYKLVIS